MPDEKNTLTVKEDSLVSAQTKFTVSDQMFKRYKLDVSRITTLEEVIAVLQGMNLLIFVNEFDPEETERFAPIRHLMVEI